MANNLGMAAAKGAFTLPRLIGQRMLVKFKKHLFLSNVLISSGLFGTADGIEQTLEIKLFKVRTEWDAKRTMRMMACGLIIAPFDHFWYAVVLDRILPGGRSRSVVFRKILADQLIASPMVSFLFFMAMGTMEGRTTKSSANEFTSKFPAVYAADWCFWPGAQYVNFTYLPREYRVVYVNSCVILWYSFLSYMKHTHDPKGTQRAAAAAAKQQQSGSLVTSAATPTTMTKKADGSFDPAAMNPSPAKMSVIRMPAAVDAVAEMPITNMSS